MVGWLDGVDGMDGMDGVDDMDGGDVVEGADVVPGSPLSMYSSMIKWALEPPAPKELTVARRGISCFSPFNSTNGRFHS